MTISDNTRFFVFDVESIGPYGTSFALGGVVVDRYGTESESIFLGYDPFPTDAFEMGFEQENIDFVKRYVMPAIEVFPNDNQGSFTKECIIELAQIKDKYPGIIFVADCPFPVETSFLQMLHNISTFSNQLNPLREEGTSPYPFIDSYPLIDVASFLLSYGFDPTGDYGRYLNEKPRHNPLADARQSARVLTSLLQYKSPYKLGVPVTEHSSPETVNGADDEMEKVTVDDIANVFSRMLKAMNVPIAGDGERSKDD